MKSKSKEKNINLLPDEAKEKKKKKQNFITSDEVRMRRKKKLRGVRVAGGSLAEIGACMRELELSLVE